MTTSSRPRTARRDCSLTRDPFAKNAQCGATPSGRYVNFLDGRVWIFTLDHGMQRLNAFISEPPQQRRGRHLLNDISGARIKRLEDEYIGLRIDDYGTGDTPGNVLRLLRIVQRDWNVRRWTCRLESGRIGRHGWGGANTRLFVITDHVHTWVKSLSYIHNRNPYRSWWALTGGLIGLDLIAQTPVQS